MKSSSRFHSLTCLFVLLAGSVSAAPRSTVATGFEYSSGKYGGDVESKSYSTLLAAQTKFGPFALGVSCSYLWITNPGVSIPGVGPLKQETITRLAASNPRLAARLQRYNTTSAAASTTTIPEEKVNGVGDATVFGTWTFKELGGSGIVPNLGAEVKFGTADEEKGLGTGKNDYSLTGGLEKDFEGYGIALDAGYQFLGDPEGFDLKDGAFAAFTVWREIGKKGTLEASADWCSKTSADVDDSAIIRLRYTHYFTSNLSVSASVGAGLTDSSPDLTAGARFRFAF